MTASNDKDQGEVANSHVPPPTDPYVTYQTPYERRHEQPNPFIEFRRFADEQFASIFGTFVPSRPVSSEKMPTPQTMQQWQRDVEHDISKIEEMTQRMLNDEDLKKFQADPIGVFASMIPLEGIISVLTSAKGDGHASDLKQPPIKDVSKHLAISDSSLNEDGTTSPWIAARTERTSKPAESHAELPKDWLETTTADGKKYYINTATNVSSATRPLAATSSVTETITEPLSSEERSAKWQRGLDRCPELNKHKEETELDVYEQMEQLEAATQRAHAWRRGFLNCPELKEIQQVSEDDNNNESCPAMSQHRLWNVLPTYGFDGMKKARNIPLVVNSDGEIVAASSSKASSTEKQSSQQSPDLSKDKVSPQSVLDAVRTRQTQILEQLNSTTTTTKPSQAVVNPNTTSVPESKVDLKPTAISTLTRTVSHTLPDGSVETRRVLRKRFSDGREESEESTDITPANGVSARQQDRNGTGWFWN